MNPTLKPPSATSITDAVPRGQRVFWLIIVLCFCWATASASAPPQDPEIERFKNAWNAAKNGDHKTFGVIKGTLGDYLLYPYLQYEDLRHRRARVPAGEMAAFLDAHRGWAFAPGLRKAWLRSLGKRGRWADLLAHSAGASDTIIRCHRARAMLILKQTDAALAEARALWTASRSQPDECDPVFGWLIKNDHITESLAWQRIHLAMTAGNRHLVAYLARFVPLSQRRWLEQWQRMARAGYSGLEQTLKWPDNEITRRIAASALHRLARQDAGLAAEKYEMLKGHFGWQQARRAELLREFALYSAVGLEDGTAALMSRVPAGYRDSQLLEWWARYLLSRQDWAGLAAVIGQMPEETRNDDRWRYWLAQSGLRSGNVNAQPGVLQELASGANYYGFLAADELGLAYNICPLTPEVEQAEIDRLAQLEGFRRALELRKAGLEEWATSEWSLAAQGLETSQLQAAAALANREGWHDRAIFALGNSGDLRFYEWRFPLAWETEIKSASAANNLDPAWVYGTIRSESAMAVTAQSSANALGLMQVTGATGKQVARKHGLPWRGSAQLKTVAGNLPLGTAYMNDLLQEYSHNPVLASGSYNAGPRAVERWLETRPLGEAAIWIETLPYHETRDYIPRVLAFTTIYDWRLGGSAKRISARMPHIESGKIRVRGLARVECREQT